MTAVIFIYTAALTVRNLFTIIKVRHRTSNLEEQRDHFRERIAEDETALQSAYVQIFDEKGEMRLSVRREHLLLIESADKILLANAEDIERAKENG